MKKIFLIFFFILSENIFCFEDFFNLGNVEIKGELRRPLISTINSDRKFDKKVDESLWINYLDFENELTKINLDSIKTVEELLIEDLNRD